jgi:hypothetical protein
LNFLDRFLTNYKIPSKSVQWGDELFHANGQIERQTDSHEEANSRLLHCKIGMTVHLDKFLVNKTNRRTEFQFYWYCDCTGFGQPFCPSSGALSRTSALVHFMQFDDRLLPGAGWNSILLLVANGHQIA